MSAVTDAFDTFFNYKLWREGDSTASQPSEALLIASISHLVSAGRTFPHVEEMRWALYRILNTDGWETDAFESKYCELAFTLLIVR